MVDRSSDWMSQALRDLELAEKCVTDGFYEWACFLSQQSSEKAVKAVFQALGGEAWGHSVSDLLAELPGRYKPPDELIDLAKEVDKAYIPTRYPNAHPSGPPFKYYTRREAERLVSNAKRIIKYCKDILEEIRQERSR